MKSIVYFTLKYLLRYYNHIYFRNVSVYGYENIPKEGGVLFSPNHQGAFLDPLIIGSMTPKKITSLTRSDVFGGPLQWFLDAFQMLPVYRIRNGFSNLKKNDAIFEQCYEILGSGKFLMMFSEGGHHDEYYLKRLSKGSSRLAFQAQLKNPTKKIYLMPVGINYGHHKQPRCTLHLVYGNPLLVSQFISKTKTEAENINILRLELQNRMRDCIWLPENTDTYPLQKERINRLTTTLEFEPLKNSLSHNFEQLPKRRKLSIKRRVLAHLLGIPNLIPLWITRFIIGKFEDVVFVSSMKYAMGVFFFPLWWLVTAIPIAYGFGNLAMTYYLVVCIFSLFLRQRILLS
ncbi:lysophospholipid acyltransferase family protein [Flavobacteriaceae bacterium]|nr:lysophospholipid acyltransferase family protein [Flavobacteriaceae bacterium]MDA7808431.1 lysophospholipid acyltransferase family protein [Flavobacteriaceae bacterium]MDA8877080.1 lysophospholipid acyltransferase family protein [Flavobacteriaceae bacterium]MDC0872216.1 lysophospholipid acyltransferase family protein [Flavobacteriaceae bacterium]